MDARDADPDCVSRRGDAGATEYMLVLIWHLLDEVGQQSREYLRGGGRFIVPLPRVRTLTCTL